MFGLGSQELIVLAVILVLLFGAKKIPELARGVGEAIRHIRGGFSDEPSQENTQIAESTQNTPGTTRKRK